MMLKYKFRYSTWPGATVTVTGNHYHDAFAKACSALDRRYEKADLEPPVGWTLELLSATPVNRTGTPCK